ncbi:MAG: hypothetical protein DRI57_23700, partial [Deltaproteobacteria bacterium]
EQASFWIDAHNKVVASGVPNFRTCRIPVRSALVISQWRSWQARIGSPDKDLADLLEYGWPLGYSSLRTPVSSDRNHSGAVTFDKATDEYLEKEVQVGAIQGPFVANPLGSDLVFSPINSIPKRGVTARRFVSDLSFPRGNSVNDGIDIDTYLGVSGKVTYPSVDDFVKLVQQQGSGSLLFKRDLSRAYRQFFLDPADICFQGFRWRGNVYFDCALVMGCKSAAMMCQRATTAISLFLLSRGVSICAYLDDFAGCSSPQRAEDDFALLGSVLAELGLVEAARKAHSPSTTMEFLGIQFNTIDMTLSITPTRLIELRSLLDEWRVKKSASKKEIQSLVGKLQFAARCVPAGRLFISRILELLRGLREASHRKRVGSEFKKDIDWWWTFLDTFNGISVMLDHEWLTPDAFFSTDACLQGGGGWVSGEFFSLSFPQFLLDKQWHINSLELLVLLLGLRLWAPGFKGKKLKFFCDNEATVAVINSGRCKDPVMLSLLREVAFVCATNECLVRAVHLAGVENRLADALSRKSSLSQVALAELEFKLSGWKCRTVDESWLNCRSNW